MSLHPSQSVGRYICLFAISIVFLCLAHPAHSQAGITVIAPLPQTPLDEALTTSENTPPLGIPTFTWLAVPGATLYQLQINRDQNFEQANILDVETPNVQYTPTDATPFTDGDYYWRVRVVEPDSGSEFSEVFAFHKQWATANNAPALIAPVNEVLLAFLDAPAFHWGVVTGAARYRFQIAASPSGFTAPVYSIDTTGHQHQPANKLPNGSYYWRVLPLDPAGAAGTASAVWSFTLDYGSAAFDQVPVLLSPQASATLTFTPTFQWTAIPGAQAYRLEYTPGPSCDFEDAISVSTGQTSYTPTTNFPNPSIYCWRVRVQSGASIGDWSETRTFTKNWGLTTDLLTPIHAYPLARTPFFSWTPVSGAAAYLITLSDISTYEEVDFSAVTANPFWVFPEELPEAEYTWQVTPLDSSGQPGSPSQPASFTNPLTATVPTLVYPYYYYTPNDPYYSGGYTLNPVTDNTAALPIFIWQRVLNPSPYGGLLASAYRIQVSTGPGFLTPAWQYDTEATTASPTLDHPFSPAPNQDYYWRVCPLDALEGDCIPDPYSGEPLWSQVWIARFDPALVLPATTVGPPALIRPAGGHEQVEATPLLEWWPLAGSTGYDIELSCDPNFGTIEHEDYTTLPVYASPRSLAQRSLNRLDYGTFYWRVRGYVDNAYTGWSEAGRFQIASQSGWSRVRSLGYSQNRLVIGDDPAGDTAANYDLTTVHVSQSDTAWYIGFGANVEAEDMTYVIYIDLDHRDGSGASAPPQRTYTISTVPAHQPEIVVYIDQIGGILNAHNTLIYTWNGVNWSSGQTLYSQGGAITYIAGAPGIIEVELPDLAIVAQGHPDSLAVMILSASSTGVLQDSVPSDPNIPGSGVLSRFSSASDRMNPVYPPNGVNGDAGRSAIVGPLYWDWPTGADPSGGDPAPPTPYAGAQIQIALDAQFLIIVSDVLQVSNARYIGSPIHTSPTDLSGDGTYYWRVRPRYLDRGEYFGAWSLPWIFTRSGYAPQNLTASTEATTPQLSWDMVEGAGGYQLQLSTASNFTTTIINVTTPLTSFTPVAPLAAGRYYWRVGALRSDVSLPTWSPAQQFTLAPPAPLDLLPDDSIQPISSPPVLCWQPLVIYSGETAIASAWKYRLQISADASFSVLVDQVDTEMHCWTPMHAYPEGVYSWRVAMLDSAGQPGPYSLPAVFRIQYQPPALLSPVNMMVAGTPSFVWTPVPGAAFYRLEVSLQTDFTPLVSWTQTANTGYTPTSVYPPGQSYYWRVATVNADNALSEYASARITIGSTRIWLPIVVTYVPPIPSLPQVFP